MTEQPEWLSKYGGYEYAAIDRWRKQTIVDKDQLAFDLITASGMEIQSLNDRIALLEAGQRELEARLGDGE